MRAGAERRFRDRAEAGHELAVPLAKYAGQSDVVVLGLPRGGVTVAAGVAEVLGAPLDIFLVGRLDLPGYGEYAIGAVAENGLTVLDDGIVAAYGVGQDEISRIKARELRALDRRASRYRGSRSASCLNDRTAIVVDDGLATGSAMEVAVRVLRSSSVRRIVVATPVGSRRACARMAALADETVCLWQTEPLTFARQWYDDFSEPQDPEVVALIGASVLRMEAGAANEGALLSRAG